MGCGKNRRKEKLKDNERTANNIKYKQRKLKIENIMNSNRTYKVTGFEGNSITSIKISLEELINNNKEYKAELLYALQEELDNILDLKSGQSKYIRLSRDNNEDLGVIKRM